MRACEWDDCDFWPCLRWVSFRVNKKNKFEHRECGHRAGTHDHHHIACAMRTVFVRICLEIVDYYQYLKSVRTASACCIFHDCFLLLNSLSLKWNEFLLSLDSNSNNNGIKLLVLIIILVSNRFSEVIFTLILFHSRFYIMNFFQIKHS